MEEGAFSRPGSRGRFYPKWHISSALKMGGIYVKDGRYIRKVSPEQRNGGRQDQGRVGSEKSVLELRVW